AEQTSASFAKDAEVPGTTQRTLHRTPHSGRHFGIPRLIGSLPPRSKMARLETAASPRQGTHLRFCLSFSSVTRLRNAALSGCNFAAVSASRRASEIRFSETSRFAYRKTASGEYVHTAIALRKAQSASGVMRTFSGSLP